MAKFSCRHRSVYELIIIFISCFPSLSLCFSSYGLLSSGEGLHNHHHLLPPSAYHVNTPHPSSNASLPSSSFPFLLSLFPHSFSSSRAWSVPSLARIAFPPPLSPSLPVPSSFLPYARLDISHQAPRLIGSSFTCTTGFLPSHFRLVCSHLFSSVLRTTLLLLR